MHRFLLLVLNWRKGEEEEEGGRSFHTKAMSMAPSLPLQYPCVHWWKLGMLFELTSPHILYHTLEKKTFPSELKVLQVYLAICKIKTKKTTHTSDLFNEFSLVIWVFLCFLVQKSPNLKHKTFQLKPLLLASCSKKNKQVLEFYKIGPTDFAAV